MPLDFKKLMDPEWSAKVRRELEAEQAKAQERDKMLRDYVDTALDHYEQLTERERDFVRSCRTRLNTYVSLSEPQEKWMRDIAARFA